MRFTATAKRGKVGLSVIATNRTDAAAFLQEHYGDVEDLRYSPTLYSHIADRVTVRDDDDVAEEPMINACFRRIAHITGEHDKVTLQVQPRKPNGWLEYGISIVNRCGSRLYVAAIQREPDAEIEFHS